MSETTRNSLLLGLQPSVPLDPDGPSLSAWATARALFHRLPDIALGGRLAVVGREINYFLGNDPLFQILIDEDGVSYYGAWDGEEHGGSDVDPDEFPLSALARFLAHIGPQASAIG